MLIKPHDSQNFAFTITAPVNAEPEDILDQLSLLRYRHLILRDREPLLSQEIGALILYEIPGNAKEQATCWSFAAEKSFTSSDL